MGFGPTLVGRRRDGTHIAAARSRAKDAPNRGPDGWKIDGELSGRIIPRTAPAQPKTQRLNSTYARDATQNEANESAARTGRAEGPRR